MIKAIALVLFPENMVKPWDMSSNVLHIHTNKYNDNTVPLVYIGRVPLCEVQDHDKY